MQTKNWESGELTYTIKLDNPTDTTHVSHIVTDIRQWISKICSC